MRFQYVIAVLMMIAGGAPARGNEDLSTPLPSSAIQSMASWCNNTLLVMRQARQDAEASLVRGDYGRAEAVLRQGLVDADQAGRRFRGNGPITARAISRGILLSNAIGSATAQGLGGGRTRTYFLFNYYDFVADIIENLDLPLYLPYRECGMCSRVNATLFEQRFVDYARRQVEMVLGTLAERMPSHSYGPAVVPVGLPEAFLKALEMASADAASDLRESLWGARYSCAINELESLSRKLADFNSGGSSFYDEIDAVNRGYFSAEEALTALQDTGCRFRHGRSRY